jgi:hypothetical protein
MAWQPQIAIIPIWSKLGGSDCHIKEQVGRAFTVFKNPLHTIEEVVEEIKKGNCEGAFA